MNHSMKLDPVPFEMIKSGQKTIELRLYDEKRQEMFIGDTIEFTSTADPSEKLTVCIRELYIFDSFEELYQKLPLLKCGYTESTLPSASPSDMERYYPKEKQDLYGVVGIEIQRALPFGNPPQA